MLLKLCRWPGLNDEALNPPGPGETSPENPSAKKIPTSRPPSRSMAFTESAIPNSVNAVTTARKMKNQMYHEIFTPYCAFTVSWTSKPVNAQTDETATGSYRKYSQVVIQPKREPTTLPN